MTRRLLEHKGVILVAALVLVVTIGAVAWAEPGEGTGGRPQGRVSASARDDGTVAEDGAAFQGFRGHGGPRGGRGVDSAESKDRMEQRRDRMEQRRDRMEQRRDQAAERRQALLDLVREKMSPEDQAALDRLTAQAEHQRDVLEKARDALMDTNQQIRELIGTYVPPDSSGGGGLSGEHATP